MTYAAAAAAFTFAGWLISGIPDAGLVPMTAGVALAGATGLGIVGLRNRILTSPLILLGIPLLLSLAAAMQPITRIFGEWDLGSLSEVIVIVAAPIIGVLAALFVSPGATPRLQRGTATQPHPVRLIVVCLLMCVLGVAAYVQEWSRVGGPPLLSADIDEARFAINYGLAHVLTQGLPLALLIATWARLGCALSFTATQRRMLEAIICFVPIPLVLGGGRSLVVVPLLSAVIVGARYVPVRVARRAAIVVPIVMVVFSSVIFLARSEQQTGTVVGTVLYNDTGAKSSLFEAAFRSLSINLGEQLRVVKELRDADIRAEPFTTSIWFAHNFIPRAEDPHTYSAPNAGGWLTTMYAGPLLLDFGLIPALLFGLVFGAVAHALYRRYARGDTVTIIWIYAYLSAPIAFAFYINVFLYFLYPLIDLLVLFVLSRLLIRAPISRSAAPQSAPLAVTA